MKKKLVIKLLCYVLGYRADAGILVPAVLDVDHRA